MKNVSIRTLLVFSFAVIVSFLLMIAAISMLSSSAEKEASLRQEERYTAYLLADELRQSSDDLTRLARTYVVSGGLAEYERQYNDILDIRDGKKPRPQEYQRIYWDFIAAGQNAPRPATTAVPLLTLMQQAGFSSEELAKLAQAAANSNELVQTEVKAMNAVKGLYADSQGHYTISKAPDLEMARTLLHSREYHVYKAKIMAPVDEFFVLLDKRTATQVAQSVAYSQTLKTLLLVTTTLAVVVSLLLGWLLFRKIVPPVRKLVDAAQSMAEGKFDFKLNHDSQDELGALTQSVGAMQLAVQTMMTDATLLSKAAVEGKLATRADASKHQGDFRKIVQGVNDTLDAVIGPLNVAAKYVDDISRGAIPAKITDTYNGDFNTLKNNLNTCIDAVNALVVDAGILSKAAVEGKLATRADASKHQGDFRKIVQGVNDTLDAVIGPLNVAAKYVD
ncbi:MULTISPECIES: HAMP domain-containing protein, partial [Giesbergeria]